MCMRERKEERPSLLEIDVIDKVAKVNNKSGAIILYKLYNSNFKFSEMDARRKLAHKHIKIHRELPSTKEHIRRIQFIQARIIRQHLIPANKQHAYKTCRF